ncbi:hypothetical protein [Levilactobacillus enshiensis]|uniref:hypothetical protein n=1 Tax=Levilactobacillus enshiensis TaxID=2590213 RepID=UPI00117B5C99|nr:hypothetical protein [Levilactobacillus enshiensis]
MSLAIYNVNRDVARILQEISEVKAVHSAYPDKITIFPAAIYQTKRSPFNRDANNVETDTSWTVTIDVFKQQGSLTAITDEITDKFSQIGFAGSVQQANQAGFNRSIITLTGIVDNQFKRVYQAR